MSGFKLIKIGPAVDIFSGAVGEINARIFDVYSYTFLGRKPIVNSHDILG